MSHSPPLSFHPLILDLFSSSSTDGLCITKKETIRALTGLIPIHPTEREAFLLIKPDQAFLCHTPFVKAPISPLFKNQKLSSRKNLQDIIKNFFSTANTIGIEKKDMKVDEWEKLQITIPHADFIDIDGHLNFHRQFKTAKEITYLKKAGHITGYVIDQQIKQLTSKPPIGITEHQLAKLVETNMIKAGADGIAFPTIVAFNAHTAKPHHQPNTTTLKPNSIILIDCGATYKGYCSDITRTISIGKEASTLFSKIESVVRAAYQKAVSTASSPSPTASAIDMAARKVITKAGFGKQFIHSTGHGIGLEAHELPHINQTDTTTIKPHMTFTIEPGIYLEGKMGYRHENTFLTSNKQLINLTKLPSESS
jgi:Xaa-Pro dipeptidase